MHIPSFSFGSKHATISTQKRPSNKISCLHKDQNGILWIGTDDGLCSYNGREFMIYNHHGLPNNSIRDIVRQKMESFGLDVITEV